MRTVPEWVGASDDAMPPARVRLRIFEAHGGRCYRSGRKINSGDKWALDHVIALANGGENREGNLAPILDAPHREKTRDDMRIKSKIARIQKKNLGLWKPRSSLRHPTLKKKMDGSVVRRDEETF